MVTVRFLVVVVALVGACTFSFNYVEGHESTAREKRVTELEHRIDLLSASKQEIVQTKADIEEKLSQACSLLSAANVDNDFCEAKIAQSEEADG